VNGVDRGLAGDEWTLRRKVIADALKD